MSVQERTATTYGTTPVVTPDEARTALAARAHLAVRLLAVVGLGATAWVHVPVTIEHWAMVPYLGVAFAVLVVASAALAGSLLVDDSTAVWVSALVLAAASVVAYAVSRQFGLPGMSDDIGDWANTAGLVAVGAELLVTATAATVLVRRRRRERRTG